jgi:glycosidase
MSFNNFSQTMQINMNQNKWRENVTTDDLPLFPSFMNQDRYTFLLSSSTTVESLQQTILSCLNDIEGLTNVVWDEKDFTWKIEYGTQPLKDISYEVILIINEMKLVAMHAANKARQLFPWLAEEENSNNPPKFIEDYRGWNKNEIRLYKYAETNSVMIHFNRMCGCRSTSRFIWSTMKTHLNDTACMNSLQFVC